MNDQVTDATSSPPHSVFPVLAPSSEVNTDDSAIRLSNLLVGLGDAATGDLAAFDSLTG